jgi:oligoribonuclease NrnB/cAMP/cGMP phosphodiesterase (DHH superfamily)
MHNGKYIHDGGEYMRGGAAHKNKASAVNRKRIAHRISNKTTKVTGTRKMIGFSEVANDYDLFGGMSENEMKNISRAATNQKNQFHEETIEKILSHLSNKDKMTAKAIKAIIYDEIKHSKTELSGLDKASEMLKMITKKKVDEILTQKALINKIVSYLSQKNTEKEKIAMASSNSSKHTTKTKTKTKTKTGKNKDKNFESSVEVTSSDKKSSDVMTGGERLHNSAKKSKKKSELFYF